MRAETKSLGWKEITYLIFGEPDAEEAEILLGNGCRILLSRCFEADSARIIYDIHYLGRKFSCIGESRLFSILLSIMENAKTHKMLFFVMEEDIRTPVEILFLSAEDRTEDV